MGHWTVFIHVSRSLILAFLVGVEDRIAVWREMVGQPLGSEALPICDETSVNCCDGGTGMTDDSPTYSFGTKHGNADPTAAARFIQPGVRRPVSNIHSSSLKVLQFRRKRS